MKLSTGSRCVSGSPVRYVWAGEKLDEYEAGETNAAAVAKWFAGKIANRELEQGNLRFKHFDKYKQKLEGFLESKLDRLQEGKLTPGTEVVPVGRAKSQDVYELRWCFETAMRKSVCMLQVRHYEAEPQEKEGVVFGLVLHQKDVSGPDSDINEKQNRQIDEALRLYREHSAHGWNLDEHSLPVNDITYSNICCKGDKHAGESL